MKKVFFSISLLCSAFVFNSCGDDCDPGLPPVDDIIYVNILNPNGTSFIKYINGAIPDSVKVTNLANNAVVNRYLLADSLLSIDVYDKTNGAVNKFKIAKGTYLKPDTIEVTVGKRTELDACANEYSVARFSSFKVNGVTKCTTCPTNTAITIQR